MKKWIALAVVLDLLWAVLLATFASNFVLALFHMANATHLSSVIGGVGAWLIVFVIAALQGAFTILALCLVSAFVYTVAKR